MVEDTAAIPEVNIEVAQERAKPRLVSLLFYDFANRTGNGKLNLLGIFDRIIVDAEKKRTRSFGLFIKTAETHDGIIRILILDPNGQLIAGLDFGLAEKEYPKDEKYHVAQASGGIEFDTPVEGLYWFDASYNGKSLGGTGLQVDFNSSEKKMGTTQASLKRVYPSVARMEFIEYPGRTECSRPTAEATDAHDTVNVSEYAMREYQSIASLRGKYADDPFWDSFPDFLEEYDRQINDLYEE